MEAIKLTLFSNWHVMRWVRLGFGIFMTVQAWQFHDWFAGVIAFFFLYQAVTNTGCCGGNGCAIPSDKTNNKLSEPVVYTEVTSSGDKNIK